MFLVFNKEKVCAYIVSVITVCLLFFIAETTNQTTVETSINAIHNQNEINSNENIALNN